RKLELLEFRQRPAAEIEIAPAGVGEGDGPGRAVEQARGQAIFQGRHRPGDRGRRAPEMPRRGDEAALLGNGDEGGKLVETVHRIIALLEIDSANFDQLNRGCKLSISGPGGNTRSEMDGLTDKNTAPSPWHSGERALQASAGLGKEKMDRIGRAVFRDFMTEQHRDFFAELPFLVVGSIGTGGMPAASLLAGPPGFIASPDPRRLDIAAHPIPGDPLLDALKPGAPVGLLGIELWTRRRNRMNGRVIAADARGFSVAVDQSFGNCPQYIQRRDYLLRREL